AVERAADVVLGGHVPVEEAHLVVDGQQLAGLGVDEGDPEARRVAGAGPHLPHAPQLDAGEGLAREQAALDRWALVLRAGRGAAGDGLAQGGLDRKSTRLNS